MTTPDLVFDLLGGPKILGRGIRGLDGLRRILRRGLPFAALEAFSARFGIGRSEAAEALCLKTRSFARRKEQDRLRPEESDRLVRLARLSAHAVQVLGDEAAVARWLHAPNRALGGVSPLSQVDTDMGAAQVEQVLGRIEHGVVS